MTPPPRAPGSGSARRAGVVIGLIVTLTALSVATGRHPALEPHRADQEARRVLSSRRPSSSEIDRLARLTQRSLARRPLDGAAHLRLAYLTVLGMGRLDAGANDAILASYAAEPLGSEITVWRIAFGLDNWSSATPQVREAILTEMAAVYPRRSWDLDAIARQTTDEQGRMVGVLTTGRLRRELQASVASTPQSGAKT